jgi:hypothetical protein
MNQQYYENAARLLDLISEVAERIPEDSLAVSFLDDGSISMHPELIKELHKDENSDLAPWAHQNLKSLF